MPKKDCCAVTSPAFHDLSTLSDDTLSFLYSEAQSSAINNSALFKSDSGITQAPFTLLSSPVAESQFKFVCDIQCSINKLYHELSLPSMDHSKQSFLEQQLSSVAKSDDFTRRLLDIYRKKSQAIREGKSYNASLGIFRSDYMMQTSEAAQTCCEMRQIEVNTISASFVGLTESVGRIHTYIGNMGHFGHKSEVPPNHCLDAISDSVVRAINYYRNAITPVGTTDHLERVVVFVVLPDEPNVVDQNRLAEAISCRDHLGVKVLRRTMEQLAATGKRDLWHRFVLDSKYEVVLFYFRSGYIPQHYPTEACWKIREEMDISLALSCPSVAHQLAGLKKIQQVLCTPGTVERFLPSQEAARVRATFAKQYSLDAGAEGDKAIELALSDPHNFVLKPQLEGGANNFYDDELVAKLNQIKDSPERDSFILMERIFPPSTKNIIVKSSKPYSREDICDVISELGIYGCHISSVDGSQLHNDMSGHLLRSKDIRQSDGGIVAGNACLDSVRFAHSSHPPIPAAATGK